jgi:hypothetical protein
VNGAELSIVVFAFLGGMLAFARNSKGASDWVMGFLMFGIATLIVVGSINDTKARVEIVDYFHTDKEIWCSLARGSHTLKKITYQEGYRYNEVADSFELNETVIDRRSCSKEKGFYK